MSLLICSFFIYGLRHTNWRGYMKHFFLYSTLHETAIKWWVHKSLLEWGFRHNLVCFSQSQRCTDYNDFFHCSIRPRVSYCLLWTAICLIKKKYLNKINFVFSQKQNCFYLSLEHWKLVYCYLGYMREKVIAYFELSQAFGKNIGATKIPPKRNFWCNYVYFSLGNGWSYVN